MNPTHIRRVLGFLSFTFAASIGLAAPQGFHNSEAKAVESFLREHFHDTEFGFVVGLVDEGGSQVFGSGRLDNGTDQRVDGDTVFEIGSITKTFASLLLLEMVDRGEIGLEDRVTDHLPKHVRVPARGEHEITLLNLAAQDSGLPFDADNLASGAWWEAYNAYRVEDLYAFLSKHKLAAEPGADFRYSNIGMSLLGHVMERRSGVDFETLVRERICSKLGMNDTCITLSPEQASRLARGHSDNGDQSPYYDFKVMVAAGSLKSTANDMLKYLSAQLGFRKSTLYPLMQQTHAVRHPASGMGKTAMPWFDRGVYQPTGSNFLGHGGGTIGFSTFIGFDTQRRRGVVVLSNQRIVIDGERPWLPACLGWTILQGLPLTPESGRRPVYETVGVGLGLGLDQKTQTLRVTKVFPRSPAGLAELNVGLVVKRIDGKAIRGKSLAECLALIRGQEGQTVRLDLFDPSNSTERTVDLTRVKFLTTS